MLTKAEANYPAKPKGYERGKVFFQLAPKLDGAMEPALVVLFLLACGGARLRYLPAQVAAPVFGYM